MRWWSSFAVASWNLVWVKYDLITQCHLSNSVNVYRCSLSVADWICSSLSVYFTFPEFFWSSVSISFFFNYLGRPGQETNSALHFFLYKCLAKGCLPGNLRGEKWQKKKRKKKDYFQYYLERPRCTTPVLLPNIWTAKVPNAHALPMLYKLLGRFGTPLPPRFRRPWCNSILTYQYWHANFDTLTLWNAYYDTPICDCKYI